MDRGRNLLRARSRPGTSFGRTNVYKTYVPAQLPNLLLPPLVQVAAPPVFIMRARISSVVHVERERFTRG